MATRPSPRPRLVTVDAGVPAPSTAHRNPVNLANQAYERIESMLICCDLAPGRFLATHELQTLTGFGRTPVHQALSRLAADTLVHITPRHGVRIAPIDLTRERRLLGLRRDMERFVIRLATERSGASQRNRMQHIRRQLVEHGADMGIDQFNVLDRMIDQLLMAAASEPFVEATLRPLHTLFRRIGWLYHMRTPAHADLRASIDGHIAVIDAVAEGRVAAAIGASDDLMAFVDDMFDVLEREVSPSLLDCTFDPAAG
jgi:DNA-binding GntR family transcriptional regulator